MSWFIKRTGQALFTIIAVVTITFALVRLMPGSAAAKMRQDLVQNNPGLSSDEINQMVAHYVAVQPDKPIHLAYVDYMMNLMVGDLGHSLRYGEPVNEIVARALPWTIFIMALSTLLTFGLAIGLGAIMAYREGSRFDLSLSGVGTLLSSIPYYVAAVFLIMFLGNGTDVLPARNKLPRGVEPGFTFEFVHGAFQHATLPVASFVITSFGIYALAMRGNSIQVLGEDYVRVANLRGLPDRRIALRYVGRNAVLPMYTSLLISIGFMFGGAIILEQLFQYHGIGYYMLQAIGYRDHSLMMGTFLVITVAVVIAVWVADATYGLLDPRIKSGDESEAY